MGGLISHPFRQRSITDSDLNKFINPGWGMVSGSSFKNIPNGAYAYGVVLLIGSPNSYERMTQLYIPDNNTGIYFRSSYSGPSGISQITTEWQKLSFAPII